MYVSKGTQSLSEGIEDPGKAHALTHVYPRESFDRGGYQVNGPTSICGTLPQPQSVVDSFCSKFRSGGHKSIGSASSVEQQFDPM